VLFEHSGVLRELCGDVDRIVEIYANVGSNRIGDRAAERSVPDSAAMEIGVSVGRPARIYLDRRGRNDDPRAYKLDVRRVRVSRLDAPRDARLIYEAVAPTNVVVAWVTWVA